MLFKYPGYNPNLLQKRAIKILTCVGKVINSWDDTADEIIRLIV